MITFSISLSDEVAARLLAAAVEEQVPVEELTRLCLEAAVRLYDAPPVRPGGDRHRTWRVAEIAVQNALEAEREAKKAAPPSKPAPVKKASPAPRQSTYTPPPAVLRFGRTKLMETHDRQCRWDVGDGFVCGEVTPNRSLSYCAEHAMRVKAGRAAA